MLSKQSKIAVIGAGGIGGITGALLAQAGYDVEMVCKHQEVVDLAKSSGMHITGMRGEHDVIMNAVKNINELSGTKDIIFHATKATDMIDAARELLPFLNKDSVVVSLQNGICEDALAAVLGRDRVIGCVVGWGATMHAPGNLEMTSKGEFVIGNIDHRTDERLPLIKDILSSVLPVKISENIIGYLYSKLIINSCITSLGAVCGLYLGEMLKKKNIRVIFIAIMREAMAVAGAMKIKVEPYRGILDYNMLVGRDNFIFNHAAHLMIKIVGMKFRLLKSSMLQSLERGRKTEIDFLNGYICENGRKYNVPTPVNDAIVKIIKEIEAGKREISLKNFEEEPFLKFTHH